MRVDRARSRLVLIRLVPALLCTGGLLALSSCGSAVPQSNGPTGLQQPSTTVSPPVAIPSSSSGPSSLAELKPCELLTPPERSTVGLTAQGQDKLIGMTRACDWTEPGAFGVSITLDHRSGLAELKLARKTATTTKVGAHRALEVKTVQLSDKKTGDGSCAVLLGIGESTSVQVDVSNTNFANTALACRRARTVAGLIEPKLP